MKKFLLAFILVLSLNSFAFAELKIGTVTNIPALTDEVKNAPLGYYSDRLSVLSKLHSQDDEWIFFDDFSTMLTALNSGVINELDTFAVTASYILNTNPEFKLTCIDYSNIPMFLSMGFRNDEDGYQIRDIFNDAINAMTIDGSLKALITAYIKEPGKREPEIAKFAKFKDAPEIKVAVTGDLPPLDYVRADGTPAGFNTAVLAEIGRRLQVNIIPVNINSGARTAALTSGRVDVVFWYMTEGLEYLQRFVPEGVLISMPYYEFHEFMHVARKK